MAGDGAQIFDAKQKLLEELGWGENPFVKDLRIQDRESFLKYYCPLDGGKILQRLAFDTKACMLVGPKGVGKTSAIYYTYYNLPESEFTAVMFKQPPQSLEEMAEALFPTANKGGIGGLLNRVGTALGLSHGHKGITRTRLTEMLRAEPRKTVLFIDEAHLEPRKEMYMEFKYLLDDVPNLRAVFSGLDKEGFPDSLLHLVGDANVFTRRGFTKDEMVDIIRHRIEAVGGKGTHPFSQGALDEVLTEHNLLTPRYVFDELGHRLAGIAEGKINVKQESLRLSMDDELVKSAIAGMQQPRGEETKITTSHAAWWVLLSPSQQGIMQILLQERAGLTLSGVAGRAKLDQNTAFNSLYQLRGDDKRELERKKEVPFPLVEVERRLVGGRKKNVYFATEKVRNLFTV